jgi:hypothetical protein
LKLPSSLVCVAATCGFLSACDSTSSNTVTKTVIDTVYTDRFAHTAAVVWGGWTITTSTTGSTAADTADAVFDQNTTTVTAYIFWKHSSTVTLTGTVTATGFSLLQTSPVILLSGTFSDSADGKKTKMGGTYFANNISVPWTAVRKL